MSLSRQPLLGRDIAFHKDMFTIPVIFIILRPSQNGHHLKWTFPSTFFKSTCLYLNFHWSLFQKVELTIRQHCCRKCIMHRRWSWKLNWKRVRFDSETIIETNIRLNCLYIVNMKQSLLKRTYPDLLNITQNIHISKKVNDLSSISIIKNARCLHSTFSKQKGIPYLVSHSENETFSPL